MSQEFRPLPVIQPSDTKAEPLPMTQQELERYTLHRRFDRIARLVGDSAVERLMKSHVMVIGLGGVGSWAAEALARSAVGTLTLVDFDDICVTNMNRQLHALGPLVGQQKADVLAERFAQINPRIVVNRMVKFYSPETSDEIFAERPDFVIDAIDHVTGKCHLIARCRREGIPIISSAGSGGRLDPTRIRIKDLAHTERDPLAKDLRRILRKQYGFPEQGDFGVPAVYSDEVARKPKDLHYDGGKGFRCVCPNKADSPFGCEQRNLILGTGAFVTASFGNACASYVVRKITGE